MRLRGRAIQIDVYFTLLYFTLVFAAKCSCCNHTLVICLSSSSDVDARATSSAYLWLLIIIISLDYESYVVAF